MSRPERLPADPLVTEKDVEEALGVLWDVDKIAKARGRYERAEAMLRRSQALAEAQSQAATVTARRREALSSPVVGQAMEEHWNAVVGFESARAMREAAVATIDVWRTIQATLRSSKV